MEIGNSTSATRPLLSNLLIPNHLISNLLISNYVSNTLQHLIGPDAATEILFAEASGFDQPPLNAHTFGAAHVDLDPIPAVQSFYRMIEALARARGLDPDRPRHLSKVTKTQ